MSGRFIPLANDVPLDPVAPAQPAPMPSPDDMRRGIAGMIDKGAGANEVTSTFPGVITDPKQLQAWVDWRKGGGTGPVQFADQRAAPAGFQPLDPNIPLDHTSQGLGFMEGLARPLDNAAHWLGNTAVGRGIDSVGEFLGMPTADQGNAKHQAYFQSREQNGETPGGIGNFIGSIPSAVVIALATKNPWLAGAAFGAVNTEHPDSAKNVAWEAGVNAIGGGVGNKVLGAGARVLSPQVSKLVQALLDKGVRLTPGQISGGWSQKLEDGLTHLPFVGTSITNAKNQSLSDFNRGAINEGLAPLSVLKNYGLNVPTKLPDSAPSGHDAIKFAKSTLGDAYDAILPQATFRADQPFAENLSKIYGMSGDLPGKEAAYLQDYLSKYVIQPISKNGALTGEGYKQIYSKLGTDARKYATSTDTFQRDIGSGIKQTQQEMRDALYRGNPEIQPALDAIDQGYAHFKVAEGAAAKATEGIFSPAQLATASKAGATQGQKAVGNALLQNYADAGRKVLPSTVGDSGTPIRTLIQNGVAGLLGGGAGAAAMAHGVIPSMESIAMAAPMIAALRGAYTQKGSQFITKAITGNRPDYMQTIAKVLAQMKGPATYAGAASAAQLYSSRRTQP